MSPWEKATTGGPTRCWARRSRSPAAIGDRGGEIDALIGLSNTRSATGGLEAGLAVLDSLAALLPPGDGWERVNYLCRLGLFRAIRSDSAAPRLTGEGIDMAVRLGERRLTGHCLEAHAMTHSLLGRGDSVLAIMDRAEALLRATHDHASLARLASRRSDELQFRGHLGAAKVALRQVLAEAEISRNRERFAYAYGGLGSLALRMNDLPTAKDYFERAAALYDSIGQRSGAGIARHNRALVLIAAGDLAAAKSALQPVLEEALGSRDLEDEMIARQELARVAMRQADWDEARRQLDSAERSARAHGRGDEARAHLAYDRGRLALGQGRLAAAGATVHPVPGRDRTGESSAPPPDPGAAGGSVRARGRRREGGAPHHRRQRAARDLARFAGR